MNLCIRTLIVGSAAVLFPLSPLHAEDWPQWRGPTRDCRVSGDAPWPTRFTGLTPLWRVPLGPGYSGPIVTDDRVFVTETVNQRDEVVRALDRRTGSELWKAGWSGAMSVPFFAKSNGDWIRATPAYDGNALYIAGMRDVLVCLDARTGTLRWRVDFTQRFGTPLPAFGYVSSPLIDGDFLYTQAGSSVVKLDKHTGKTLWRTLEAPGGMLDSAFSSPVIATLHGTRQLLVQTRQLLAGINLDDGSLLWSQAVPAFRGMNILTPVVYRNGILTSTHKNATYFYSVKRNADDTFAVDLAWKNKARGYMSSPVRIDGHAYLHLGNGRFSCLDLAGGSQNWRSEPFGKYCSMAVNGRTILGLTDRGELLLIDANPQAFTLLDRKTVAEDDTWGHIAVSGRDLFVRELGAIAAFTWNANPPPKPSPLSEPRPSP